MGTKNKCHFTGRICSNLRMNVPELKGRVTVSIISVFGVKVGVSDETGKID